jgi:hypothetical protein
VKAESPALPVKHDEAPPNGETVKRRLIVNDGQRERELLLVGTIVVGRDPACDVSEDGDSLLSRRHTEFVAGPDGVVVRDLGSRNGTFVNGVRIAEGPIRAGDVVHVGHLRVRYVEGDAAPAPDRTASTASTVVEDEEVTRIVQGVRPPPRAESPAAVPLPSADDERTVVTSRPGPAPVAPVNVDDERTVFTGSAASGRTPVAAMSREVPSPPEKKVPAPPAPAPAPAPDELSTFVSFQVGAVAVIALLAVILAVFLGHLELFGEAAGATTVLKWMGPPVAMALLAAYRAGKLINRRIARILTADNEKGRGV